MSSALRLYLFTLALTVLAAPAMALTPPSAMPSGLPEQVVAQYREAADYRVAVQADRWVAGPDFATGKTEWFLHGTVTALGQDMHGRQNSPFKIGGDVLMRPYCSRGTVAQPGGPGNACAGFVGRRLEIWVLLADLHAKRLPNGRVLIQAENLLDAAFLP